MVTKIRSAGTAPPAPTRLPRFGDALRAFREERGLTQGEIANFLEMDRRTYRVIESGEWFPPSERTFWNKLRRMQGMTADCFAHLVELHDVELDEQYRNLIETPGVIRRIAYTKSGHPIEVLVQPDAFTGLVNTERLADHLRDEIERESQD